MYTIIHNENEEEGFNVHFEGSWICGYASMDEARAAIQRLKAHDEWDRKEEAEMYSTGPSRSPSNVWDGLFWAD